MPEYVSAELRAKIIDIICEEWPTPNNHLESAAIVRKHGSLSIQEVSPEVCAR
jgi:hypothetical protein